jgi:hypothetical protein
MAEEKNPRKVKPWRHQGVWKDVEESRLVILVGEILVQRKFHIKPRYK